jgi:hypothetical protein
MFSEKHKKILSQKPNTIKDKNTREYIEKLKNFIDELIQNQKKYIQKKIKNNLYFLFTFIYKNDIIYL